MLRLLKICFLAFGSSVDGSFHVISFVPLDLEYLNRNVRKKLHILRVCGGAWAEGHLSMHTWRDDSRECRTQKKSTGKPIKKTSFSGDLSLSTFSHNQNHSHLNASILPHWHPSKIFRKNLLRLWKSTWKRPKWRMGHEHPCNQISFFRLSKTVLFRTFPSCCCPTWQ